MNKKQWLKQWNAENTGIYLLRMVTVFAGAFSLFLLFAFSSHFKDDWRFVYQWGSNFKMLTGTIGVICLVISSAIDVLVHMKWTEYQNSGKSTAHESGNIQQTCTKCKTIYRGTECPYCNRRPSIVELAQEKTGDKRWSCQKCNEINNASIMFCRSCGDKKPSIAEMHGESNMTKYQGEFSFGGGAKAWFVICGVLSIISGCISAYIGASTQEGILFFAGIIGAAGGGSYIDLLIKKRKISFFIIAVVAVIMLFINLSMGVGALSIFGMLNPIITFLILKKDWDYLD